jgi:luciferase family oxidoreductase group 1
MSVALSILDLAPVPEGTGSAAALRNTIELAKVGDEAGYRRLWYAEHHGMASIASSSPEVLIATAAAHTSRIRVGSGGVMLPNHVPLRVVETYRTLNGLHPGRIDLGIGRAGGSDGRTLNALRSIDGSYFPQELAELLAFEQGSFPPDHPYARVEAIPQGVELPPIFMLGSSGASASAAGELGVGYSFAAHFSPTPPAPAFAAYRAAFRPSAQFDKPHAILAVSAIVAPTSEEARQLSISQAVSWALFMTGEERKLLSPEEASARQLTVQQQAVIERQGKLWIIGDPAEVSATIATQAEAAGADEVMVTTTIWSHQLRLRSYRLLAEAWGLQAGTNSKSLSSTPSTRSPT